MLSAYFWPVGMTRAVVARRDGDRDHTSDTKADVSHGPSCHGLQPQGRIGGTTIACDRQRSWN